MDKIFQAFQTSVNVIGFNKLQFQIQNLCENQFQINFKKTFNQIHKKLKQLIYILVIISLILSCLSFPNNVYAGTSKTTNKNLISPQIITNKLNQSMQIGSDYPIDLRPNNLLRANLAQTAQYFVDGPYSLVISGARDSQWKKFGYIQVPNVLSSDVRGVFMDWNVIPGHEDGGFTECNPNVCGNNQLWQSSSPFNSYGNHICIGVQDVSGYNVCEIVLGAGNWLETGRPFNHSAVQSGTVGVGGFFSECWNCSAGEGWTSTITNIYIIYHGIPPAGYINRSFLSTNTPKNGLGDSRECAINGCSNAQATAGDPINTLTGNFDYSLVDLSLQTIAGPLTFQRSYASQATDTNTYPTSMSPGWSHNQDTRLIFGSGVVWLKAHTVSQYEFIDNGNQTYLPYAGVLAGLSYNAANSTYTLKASDQSIYIFTASGQLISWRNELGRGFDYSFSNNKLYRITEPVSGRYLQFNYQSNRLTSVNDSSSPSRSVSFGYNGNGDLTSFTDVQGKTWTYEYDGTSHHLSTLKDPSTPAKTILSVHYDAQGRADEQFNGKGERIVKITYNANGTSTLTDALNRQSTDGYDSRNTNTGQTNSAGYTSQKIFDPNFRLTYTSDQNLRSAEYIWSADGANLTYIKDAAGFVTNMQYDAQNHLTQVIDPNSQVITNTYSGAFLTASARKNPSGTVLATTTYTYTTSADTPQPVGLLKTVTDALSHITTFTYDSKGQLTVTKDADNKETHLAYDSLGQVTDITNPLGRITHTIYDPTGNITKVIQNYDTTKAQNAQNLYNLTTEYAYDNQGRLYQTKNTLGFTTTYAYDDAGRVFQVTDAYGKTTTSYYNAAGQVTSVVDPLGHTTGGYEYDSAGRVWKVKDGLNRVALTYAYNSDSTIQTETRPTANGDYVITNDNYDALGRPTHTFDNNVPSHSSTVAYDAYGNPLAQTDALGRVTKYEYNDLELLSAVVQNYIDGATPTADTNVRTEYSYDSLGNLKKIRDANTHETTYDYDVLNRLKKITNPLVKVTEFGYDALGNHTSVKDAKNNTTIFNYDLANRLQTIDYPTGMTDVTFGYDALSRMTGMDDSLGHTTWVYDNLNRITSITDSYNKTVGYGYDDDSKRTSITYPAPVSKSLTYQYNTLDQLEHVLDGSPHIADYTYDISGRLGSVTLGNGVSSTPGYDLSGQLTSLTYQKASLQYASYTYRYNAVGNRDHMEEILYTPSFSFLPVLFNNGSGGEFQGMGSSPVSPNSPSGSSAYPAPDSNSLPLPNDKSAIPTSPANPYPAPNSNTSSTGGTFLQQVWHFLVNLFGGNTPNVSAQIDSSPMSPASYVVDSLVSTPSSSQTIDYGYDPLNRLTSATYLSGASYSYGYDNVGNRTSQTVGGVTTTNQYDASDRLTNAGGVTFLWDDNGNLLNDGHYTYTYDFANRLASATGQGSTYTFGYDGLDNRYSQTVSGGQTTTYTFDQVASLSQVLYDGTSSYYYGLGRISQQKNSLSDFFLVDGLGSVRQLANQSGTVTFSQTFDPFGNSISQSGLGSSGYGYAGEWTDGSGLQYLRARYYSPAQGRFINRDPFSGIANQPSTLNPYAYTTNNPVLMSDPSGKFAPFLVAAIIGGAIAGAVDIFAQLSKMKPTSLGQALRCLNWGEFGVSIGAGAIAGLTGFTAFTGGLAFAQMVGWGTGLTVQVASGALSGVLSGQYGRLTGLVLSRQVSQNKGAMFRPQDMLIDLVFGGLMAGIGYGLGEVLPSKPILNNRSEPYPNVTVEGYGEVPFPTEAEYTPLNLREPRPSTYRSNYINEWEASGKPEPIDGWQNYRIHHIQPLEYGGSNDVSNLVHLTIPNHELFTQWWAGGYGPK